MRCGRISSGGKLRQRMRAWRSRRRRGRRRLRCRRLTPLWLGYRLTVAGTGIFAPRHAPGRAGPPQLEGLAQAILPILRIQISEAELGQLRRDRLAQPIESLAPSCFRPRGLGIAAHDDIQAAAAAGPAGDEISPIARLIERRGVLDVGDDLRRQEGAQAVEGEQPLKEFLACPSRARPHSLARIP